MTIFTPSTEFKTAATTTSYAQVQAAATAALPRVYLRVENTDATDALVLAVGASGSEVAIARIAPKGVFEVQIKDINASEGINFAPQGILAIKSTGNTPTYNATICKLPAALLK